MLTQSGLLMLLVASCLVLCLQCCGHIANIQVNVSLTRTVFGFCSACVFCGNLVQISVICWKKLNTLDVSSSCPDHRQGFSKLVNITFRQVV